MKLFDGGWIIVIFCLIALLCFPLSNSRGASRSVSEQVVLPTAPTGGSGGYFPPGTGIFGKTKFQLTGSGGCYSYNPAQYPVPPSSTANMGPGHCGSNEKIYLSGSVTVSGHVNVPQSMVDILWDPAVPLATKRTYCDAGWSCIAGNKLPVGFTEETGDTREFFGARNSSPLQGWAEDMWPATGTYSGGTPAWPYDGLWESDPPHTYAPYPVLDPQWDKDGDGDTDTADYDYFVAHGGFAAENGGSSAEIPYTAKDDPTIMVMDKGVLVPASEGQAWYDDYYIDDNHNFVGTWKEIYFTGTQYRFNNFESGASESYHYTGNMSFYCEDFHHGGSNDMILDPNASIVMAVKNNIVFDGESDFNVGGGADQFDVVTTGTTVNIGGSADGTAGCFYAPNANMLIEGDGWIYAAIIANSVEIGGSRSICYPFPYNGPNGGAGGGGGSGSTTINPPSRKDWKEIIVSD